MGNYLIQALLGASLIAFILTRFLIKVAHDHKFYSAQDFRRKGKTPVPLLGGLAVFIAFTSVTLILGDERAYHYIFAALPLIAIGVLDDIRELNPRWRILSQMCAVGIWLYLTPSEALVLSQLGMPAWISLLITGFWIVGIINAVNMLDGMDGEAAGFSIIVAISMAFIVGPENATGLTIFAGACMGFLAFNIPPARIYLGESGSTFLGFFLATSAAIIPFPGPAHCFLLVPLFLLAIPEVDAVMAIIRRRFANSSPLRGDHDHIHHKLQKLGFNVRQSLTFIYGAAIYSGLTAYTIHYLGGDRISWSVGLLAMLGLCTLLGAILYLEYRQAHQVSRFSRTLLHKYLPITEHFQFPKRAFFSTVYDLLPYYKELQQRGVGDVNDFIQGFADFISQTHPDSQLRIVGSYSVIVIENARPEEKSFQKKLVAKYFQLLASHKVQKNDGLLPWGLSFYSSSNKPEVFIKKFGLEKFVTDEIKWDQVG